MMGAVLVILLPDKVCEFPSPHLVACTLLPVLFPVVFDYVVGACLFRAPPTPSLPLA